MHKSTLFFLSFLIFIIIEPLLNGIFFYLFMIIDYDDMRQFTFGNLTTVIYFAYLMLAVPSALTGLLYAIRHLKCHKRTLLWQIPCIGCALYSIYLFILCWLDPIFSSSAILRISFIVILFNIAATFICTIISNTILMK